MRLAFSEAGPRDAPVVVLLHSLGTDGRIWFGQVTALEDGHHVLIPDTRGHGRSAGGETADLDAWVADLRDLLDAAAVDRASLVGLSMGGVQALAFAARHADRVDSLLLADTFAQLPPDIAAAKIDQLGGQVRELGMPAMAEAYVRDTFTQKPLPESAAVVRNAIANMSPDAYLAAVRACFSARLDDELEHVQAPALVAWGTRDAKAPRSLSDALVAGLPSARLAEIPAAGHLSPLENPAGFNALMLDWLAERSAVGGPR